MQNLHLLYNKLYYREIGTPLFDQRVREYNDRLVSIRFSGERDTVANPAATTTFKMKTLYPGLLVGIGNPHQTNMSENETKIGFAFDYTSGQPYIPGSTVKGILRSCFIQAPDAVLEELGAPWTSEDLPALEAAIFDEGDVFFDAVICKGDSEGHIMGWDFLAPHGEDAFQAPVPIRLIKVLPDVVFEFRFRTNTHVVNGKKISPGKKIHLFRNLLTTFGAGAKTNVGYGAMEAVIEKQPDKAKPKNKPQKPPEQAAPKPAWLAALESLRDNNDDAEG